MKNSYIVATLVVLAFVLGFWWFEKDKGILNPPVSGQTSGIEGCYVNRTGKDVYTLVIQYEKRGNVAGMLAYNNYQKDSSSGSFAGTFANNLLLGNYSFDAEGMHSDRQVIFKKVGNDFIQGFGPVKIEGNKEELADLNKVTYDPKSTFVKNKECILTFVEPNDTFTFEYNPFFHVSEGQKVPVLEWRVDAVKKGMLLASLTIPRTYMPKTNFSDARLTVGRSTDSGEIMSCTAGSLGETKKGTEDIGGYSFTKFSFSGAGAGNFYETTSYRGLVDGDCYVIEYTIHSTSISNYPASAGIKEFAKSKIEEELEKIINSLKFLINSD